MDLNKRVVHFLTVADVMMTQIFFFFFVDLKCHFCLDCQVKRIKDFAYLEYMTFYSAEKVSYSSADCGTYDDDTNFPFR